MQESQITRQNTSGQELKLNGDGELVTEDRVHHEIHEGDAYHMEDSYELAINGVLDIQFITGADYIHLVDLYTMESETSHYLYEGATISVNGTAANVQNKNRNSANISTVTAYYQINTSLANANADTDVSGATELSHAIVGSGRSEGILAHDNEWVLKPNTVYVFRCIEGGTAAGYVDAHLEWYEIP